MAAESLASKVDSVYPSGNMLLDHNALKMKEALQPPRQGLSLEDMLVALFHSLFASAAPSARVVPHSTAQPAASSSGL